MATGEDTPQDTAPTQLSEESLDRIIRGVTERLRQELAQATLA